MKNLLGVMQGRLLPKYKGRYQAHPVGYWQDEFPLASSIGLNCIEFILDYNDSERNPLLSIDGVLEINNIIQKTGVKVVSVCADYFMEAPLHSNSPEVVLQSQNTLSSLLKNAKKIGVKDIVIPCVDQSSLKTEKDKISFHNNLQPLVKEAENLDVNLSLETDLKPKEFLQLIKMFDSSCIKVNYDIGNSASLGFDPLEEFSCFGEFISDIHIKDRKLQSGSVELGSGDANIEKVFSLIDKINYTGPFIMQAFRDDEGLEIFKKQLHWLKKKFKLGINFEE